MRYLIALAVALAACAASLPPPSPARAGERESAVAGSPVDSVEAAPPLSGIALEPPAQNNDDEPDVLLMALLTTGAAAGAAVLGLIGYVIRNRVGFWLHRPPPREGGEPEEHH